MRDNPAIIPKRGGFFVHDDRAGAAGWAPLAEGKSETAPEEEEPVGRWRADALPPAGNKGSTGSSAASRSRDTRWAFDCLRLLQCFIAMVAGRFLLVKGAGFVRIHGLRSRRFLKTNES